MTQTQTKAEQFVPLKAILEAAHYSENGIAAISRELVGEILFALNGAQAEIDAKGERIAELERLFALNPIKVGDISVTLGVNETGEWRMTFDGADDAKLAIVAGMFSAAMRAVIESAK